MEQASADLCRELGDVFLLGETANCLARVYTLSAEAIEAMRDALEGARLGLTSVSEGRVGEPNLTESKLRTSLCC